MVKDELCDAGLHYCSDEVSGFSRIKKGKGFSFRDTNGHVIKDKQHLSRIRSLVIPPAWEKVWICPLEKGYLQATGYDDRGRKQYIYHQEWNKLRQANKFQRVQEFGKKLPRLRKRIKLDLKRRKIDKRKAIAIALELMEETLIRAGNRYYRKTNKSYGLTTLYRRQVKLKEGVAIFAFEGKKGVEHHIEVDDRKMVKHLAQILEIPGQDVFSYYGKEGEVMTLDSGDLNLYIKEYAAGDYSTKDYRTWSGTVWAFRFLASADKFETQRACKGNINACLDFVAKKLGNTRAVCRSHYVHQLLLEAYANDKLGTFFKYYNRSNSRYNETEKAERAVLRFLKTLEGA